MVLLSGGGDLPGGLAIEGAETARAAFVALPAGTLPIILAVTDPGTPPLTRYRRVIVTVGRTLEE